MNNEYIKSTAFEQSAIDLSCKPEDLLKSESMAVISRVAQGARKYLKQPLDFEMASYGTNNVVSCAPELLDFAKKFIDREDIYRCYEPNALYELSDKGLRITHMADYYLPDVDSLKAAVEKNICPLTTKILTAKDFSTLYLPEWSNALCADRKELDVLGVGAYDGKTLVGLAACSADCENMWQIGIDILPEYRQKGIAKALTSRLAVEIIEVGKVPFYSAAWSNLKSRKCALASGFRPAWVELAAKRCND